MAELTAPRRGRLPDSAFAIVLPGGQQDAEGKTSPRRLRMFPLFRADGRPDRIRIRNAMARIEQERSTRSLSPAKVAAARRRIHKVARKAGIGTPAEK